MAENYDISSNSVRVFILFSQEQQILGIPVIFWSNVHDKVLRVKVRLNQTLHKI